MIDKFKRQKAKKIENFLIEQNEAVKVDEKEEVDDNLNENENTLDVQQIFERPIIDFSVFETNQNDQKKKIEKFNRSNKSKLDESDKSFGLTLLKSFYLKKVDQNEKLRDLIDKIENEMWINPGHVVKNNSNNYSFTSLSQTSSKNSSKFKVKIFTYGKDISPHNVQILKHNYLIVLTYFIFLKLSKFFTDIFLTGI